MNLKIIIFAAVSVGSRIIRFTRYECEFVLKGRNLEKDGKVCMKLQLGRSRVPIERCEEFNGGQNFLLVDQTIQGLSHTEHTHPSPKCSAKMVKEVPGIRISDSHFRGRVLENYLPRDHPEHCPMVTTSYPESRYCSSNGSFCRSKISGIGHCRCKTGYIGKYCSKF